MNTVCTITNLAEDPQCPQDFGRHWYHKKGSFLKLACRLPGTGHWCSELWIHPHVWDWGGLQYFQGTGAASGYKQLLLQVSVCHTHNFSLFVCIMIHMIHKRQKALTETTALFSFYEY